MKLVHALAVDGWAVTFGTARRGLGAHAPPRCVKCNSPPISGQCIPITVLLYNDPLLCGFNVPIKWLTDCFKLVRMS